MQTWITDKDFFISARNLTRQHLQAQIYEGIHVQASLLKVSKNLITPKRDVSNHPVSKQWKNNILELQFYLWEHFNCFYHTYGKKDKKEYINYNNLKYLDQVILDTKIERNSLEWINDNLITIHRSVLVKKNKHYLTIWKDIPKNLNMIYVNQ